MLLFEEVLGCKKGGNSVYMGVTSNPNKPHSDNEPTELHRHFIK